MRTFPRLLTTLLTCLALVIVTREGVAQSRARTVRFQSVIGEVTLAILLPPDYETSTARYPVVYLLHGGTQNHTAFPARSWFNADVSKRRMIVVMPYLQPFAYQARGGRPAPIEEYLGEDLPKYIDANYRTIDDRRGRAIAGISMGGYGATRLGLERPDMFGAVGAISAALSMSGCPDGCLSIPLTTAEASDTARNANFRIVDPPYFFIACGVADSVLPSNRALAMTLREHRFPLELHEVPGGHDWSVWDSQVRAFFDALARLPGWKAVP